MIERVSRLAAMPGRRKAYPGARAAPALALVLLVAGCGGSSDDVTIPADQAQEMLTQLETIRGSVDNKLCDTAQDQITTLGDQIDNLPDTATVEAKAELRDAAANLSTLIADDPRCQEQPATTGTTGPSDAQSPASPDEEQPTDGAEKPPKPDKSDKAPGHQKPDGGTNGSDGDTSGGTSPDG